MNDDSVQRKLLEEAADWHGLMSSGEVSAQDREACRQWRERSARHEAAWQELDRVWAIFAQQAQALPGGRARAILSAGRKSRTKGRRALLALALLAPLTALLLHYAPPAWLLADHRSHVGELRELWLADGSTLVLNTDSAVDVVYTGTERRIMLRQGEVLVKVAADPARRPFVVRTEQGEATALGTRYVVRQLRGATEVLVTESQVKVCPAQAEPCAAVPAGQAVRMTRQSLGPLRAIDADGAEAWAHGRISVRDAPLPDVLDQLVRHRRAYFWFDRQALQGLRVSGVMPLQGDEALQALEELLPIRVERVLPGVLRITLR